HVTTRRACCRRPRPADCHTRSGAGDGLGSRALLEPARDRVRRARRGADDRRPRADVRGLDRDVAGKGRRDSAPTSPRPLMHALVHPWSETFMQLALAELVLLGVVGGVVGCWIVHYELAYSAESLAHALFPGLVGAALLGLPLLLGGAAGV